MKILLVDDNKDITNFLKKALEAECYEVDVANDGQKGEFLATTNEYDLMILDYNLPIKDGKEICQTMRKEGINVQILMLSVNSDPHTKAEILDIGADDYLTKPFSLEELTARIRALMRRPKEVQKDIIKIDNLIIDSKRHSVIRNNKPINLTLKEFMLLEYLAKSQGEVITRGMILEHVWDMNADPFSNTIEAHISNLRRKIDFKNEKKLIHTISGRGYKLDILES